MTATSGHSGTVPALDARHIGMAFPGVRALESVDLTIVPGEVHALLGENGAGKSTLIKVVTGALKPHTGTVHIAGHELRQFTPRAAQRLGVRVVHQERQIARDLSVAQNVLLADLPGVGGVVTARGLRARAQDELDRLGIAIDARSRADDLSPAEQQLVELARAVHRRSSLVVMDEPTASLRPAEVATLFRVVDGLRRAGTSLLYISHHLHEVFEIADSATVLRNGRQVGRFTVADTTSDELVTAMFDRAIAHTRLPREAGTSTTVALRADGVERAPVLGRTDVEVRRGEVLMLCGAAGSGAPELAAVLAGALAPTAGTVCVTDAAGGRLRVRGRAGAATAGIGYVPADRKADGLLLERPIGENLLLSRRGLRTWLHRPRAATRTSRRALEAGRVKADDPRRAVITLSGGNQQRVIFARWLVAGCRVLVLDQPTAGVDVAAKFEIYRQLLDLATTGLAVVAVSSDYEEISCLADRVLVMRDGAIVGELSGDDATPERLWDLETSAETSADAMGPTA